jgi:hypothetical protein
MTETSLTQQTKSAIDSLYEIGPKFAATKRIFFDEKRQKANLLSEEEIFLVDEDYVGMFDVYKYKTDSTDEYLYRFRIILDKKKERRVLFKFEAFQYTETGSLFIENFKKYKWQTLKSVFKQFLQICIAKIEFVMKINRLLLEVDMRRVDATQFMLLENELAELDYSKEKELLETDRSKVEPGTWVVYVWKSAEREQRIIDSDKKIKNDKEWHSSFGIRVAKDDDDRN